jgi:hypothetical protein
VWTKICSSGCRHFFFFFLCGLFFFAQNSWISLPLSGLRIDAVVVKTTLDSKENKSTFWLNLDFVISGARGQHTFANIAQAESNIVFDWMEGKGRKGWLVRSLVCTHGSFVPIYLTNFVRKIEENVAAEQTKVFGFEKTLFVMFLFSDFSKNNF